MRRLAFSLLAVLAATIAFAPHAFAWPGARPAAAISAGNYQSASYDGAFYVGNGLRAYYNPVYYGGYGWACGYSYACGGWRGVYGYVPYPYAAYGYRYGCGCPGYYYRYRRCGC